MKQTLDYFKKMKSQKLNQAIFALALTFLTVMPMTAQTRKKPTATRRPVATAQSKGQNSTVSKPKLVDLGLPSGTKWADRNLGAASVTAFGNFYATGETSPKQAFTAANYTGAKDIPNISGTENDAVTKKYGKGWSVPTKEQFQELFDNCEQTNAIVNGTLVIKLTGPNNNSIYIPYAPNKTMMKFGDNVKTKQLNDMFYSQLDQNPTYQNLKFAAKQGGIAVKDGMVTYCTADKDFVCIMGIYAKDNKSSQSTNKVIPNITDDAGNLTMVGMPIRPIFISSDNTASSKEENDGTIDIPE